MKFLKPVTNKSDLRKLRRRCEFENCGSQMLIYSVSGDGYSREWSCTSPNYVHRLIEVLEGAEKANV